MKHMSKLAFLAAAGMASAGAQAAEFEVADGTTLLLGGKIDVLYRYDDRNNGKDDTKLEDDGSLFAIGGERDLGNGITAYVDLEFDFNVFGEGDGNVGRDNTRFGFVGDFGEVQAGDSDSIYEDVIIDATDPFEDASLETVSGTEEKSMVTYYSPEMDGFSFALQGRHNNRDNASAKTSLLAAVQYEVGNVLLAAAYDSRGSVDADDGNDFKSEDHLVGVSAIAALTDQLDVAFKFSQQNDQDGTDTDFTSIAAVYSYGPGDLYGQLQSVDPSGGNSRSQAAAGVNYEIASDVVIFAEYGDLDRVVDGTIQGDDVKTVKRALVGLNLEF
mgnify:CR=1 FL=1